MNIGVLAIAGLSLALLVPGMFRRPKSDQQLKPVTVCEVLGNLQKYSDQDLAILGRLDCGSSVIDRTCFLVEKQCERPIATETFVWPSKVLIVDYWHEGMPKPPTGNPQIDQPTLTEKLSLIRKSTKLGLHKVALFKTEGRTITFSHFDDVKDEWGVAYGKVFNALKIGWDNSCVEAGCGDGFFGAPAALIINPDSLRRFKDEDYPNRTP